MPTADDLYRAGFAAFSRGDFGDAILQTTRALDVDPDHVGALRVLGMAHFRREEHAVALEVGRRLVEAAPKDILSYTTLSLFLQKNGFIQEAEDASAKAKVLTWKKQLRDGGSETQGLNIMDAPAMQVSEPMMPGLPAVSAPMMPGLPAKKPPAKEPAAKKTSDPEVPDRAAPEAGPRPSPVTPPDDPPDDPPAPA